MPSSPLLNNSCLMRTGGVCFRRMAPLIGTTPLLHQLSLEMSAHLSSPLISCTLVLNFRQCSIYSILHPSGCAVLTHPPSLLRHRRWCGLIHLHFSEAGNVLSPQMRQAPSMCPLAPPVASGSATTGSAGQSTSGAMGDSSSSKWQHC